jgi:hypothetical protein
MDILVRTATSQNYTPSSVTANEMVFATSPVMNTIVNTGDKVLFKDQVNASQNGVWVCQNIDRTGWSRDTDARTWTQVHATVVYVTVGPYADTKWLANIADTGVVGTSAILWERDFAEGEAEVVTSIPRVKPTHKVSIDVTPHRGVVSYGSYTWAEEHLDDDTSKPVTVPAMYYHNADELLTFTATVTPGLTTPNIVEYYWDFGDGVEKTGNPVTHTYTTSSPETICHCRARDANGDVAWASMNLMLKAAPAVLPGSSLVTDTNWQPLTTSGPGVLHYDTTNGLNVTDNFSTSLPSQSTWETAARPLDYYDTLVDNHSKLVARWKLDSTTDNVIEDSKGTVDGTISGTFTPGLVNQRLRYWQPEDKSIKMFSEAPMTITPTAVESANAPNNLAFRNVTYSTGTASSNSFTPTVPATGLSQEEMAILQVSVVIPSSDPGNSSATYTMDAPTAPGWSYLDYTTRQMASGDWLLSAVFLYGGTYGQNKRYGDLPAIPAPTLQLGANGGTGGFSSYTWKAHASVLSNVDQYYIYNSMTGRSGDLNISTPAPKVINTVIDSFADTDRNIQFNWGSYPSRQFNGHGLVAIIGTSDPTVTITPPYKSGWTEVWSGTASSQAIHVYYKEVSSSNLSYSEYFATSHGAGWGRIYHYDRPLTFDTATGASSPAGSSSRSTPTISVAGANSVVFEIWNADFPTSPYWEYTPSPGENGSSVFGGLSGANYNVGYTLEYNSGTGTHGGHSSGIGSDVDAIVATVSFTAATAEGNVVKYDPTVIGQRDKQAVTVGFASTFGTGSALTSPTGTTAAYSGNDHLAWIANAATPMLQTSPARTTTSDVVGHYATHVINFIPASGSYRAETLKYNWAINAFDASDNFLAGSAVSSNLVVPTTPATAVASQTHVAISAGTDYTAAPFTIAKPTGTQVGDLLLLVVSLNDAYAYDTQWPTNDDRTWFNFWYAGHSSGTGTEGVAILAKNVTDPNEPANYTWTFEGYNNPTPSGTAVLLRIPNGYLMSDTGEKGEQDYITGTSFATKPLTAHYYHNYILDIFSQSGNFTSLPGTAVTNVTDNGVNLAIRSRTQENPGAVTPVAAVGTSTHATTFSMCIVSYPSWPTQRYRFDLNWNPVAGATKYKIYRGLSTSSSVGGYVGETTSTSWSDYEASYQYPDSAPYSLGAKNFGQINLGDNFGFETTETYSVGVSVGGSGPSSDGGSFGEMGSRSTDLVPGYHPNGTLPDFYQNPPKVIGKVDPINLIPVATPTVDNYTTEASTTSAASTNFTINKPTGVQVGDLLVLTVGYCYSGSFGGMNTPTGWSLALSIFQSFGGNDRVFVWYKVATAADVSASTYTFNFSDTGGTYSAALMRIVGADTVDPFYDEVNSTEFNWVPSSLHKAHLPSFFGSTYFNPVANALTLWIGGSASIGASGTAQWNFSRGTKVYDVVSAFGTGASSRAGHSVTAETLTTAGPVTLPDFWTVGIYGDESTTGYAPLVGLCTIRPKMAPENPVHGWAITTGSTYYYNSQLLMWRWSGSSYAVTGGNSGWTTDPVFGPRGAGMTYFTYDGTNLLSGPSTSVDNPLATTSAALGHTSQPLVIGDRLPARVDDIQIYSPALTPTEVSTLLAARDNPYSVYSPGFYNQASLGQYKNVRVTLKYNVGTSGGRVNDFRGVRGNLEGLNYLGQNWATMYEPQIGVAVRVTDDHGYIYGSVSASTITLDASETLSGAGSGIFATTHNFTPATNIWIANQTYWLVVTANGHDFSVEHWATDPADGGTPTYQGTISSGNSAFNQIFGSGVLAGVGIAPLLPTPDFKILEYYVEELPDTPPEPPPPPPGEIHDSFDTDTVASGFWATRGAVNIDSGHISFQIDSGWSGIWTVEDNYGVFEGTSFTADVPTINASEYNEMYLWNYAAGDGFGMFVDTGYWGCWTDDDYADTILAYDATAHRYWRAVIHATTVDYQVSPDGTTWTTFSTLNHTLPFGAYEFDIYCSGSTGTSMIVNSIDSEIP